MMGTVNVVQLVLLVWTFTAVCEAKDPLISCEDVTGGVGEELNLTCTVSYPNTKCYMKMYKLINTAVDDTICKVVCGRDSCKQESKISCPYTAKKAMTTKFKLFLQTNCGTKTTLFSVNIKEAVIVGPNLKLIAVQSELSERAHLAIIPVIICLIAVIGIILKKKLNFTNTSEVQRDACDNNNSEHLNETV